MVISCFLTSRSIPVFHSSRMWSISYDTSFSLSNQSLTLASFYLPLLCILQASMNSFEIASDIFNLSVYTHHNFHLKWIDLEVRKWVLQPLLYMVLVMEIQEWYFFEKELLCYFLSSTLVYIVRLNCQRPVHAWCMLDKYSTRLIIS